MTSTELSTLTNEELMAMTGQGEAKKPGIPRLTVNKEGVDDHDNEIPIGTFKIAQGEASALYAKTAVFRPFHNTFQYAIYDAKAKATTNRSIHIKNWADEALDELGGVRCGKIPNKQAKELSAEDQEKNKLIKCYRFIYGQVTLSGVTETGTKMSVERLPVRMKLSGSNFMPFSETIDLINALKRPIFNFNCNLTLTRQKNGATVWYVVGFEPDLKNLIPMSTEDMELWHSFQEQINRENDYIKGKYKDALKVKTQPTANVKDVVDQLSNDFHDDELPENMRA